MIPLSSTDPAVIASLARCFNSCIGGSSQAALKTYLLAQVGNIATPPCLTPTAPSFVQAKATTNTTLFITWRQLSNSGSLITSYTVQWGTVSGVYTNSVVVPVTPRSYLISGLTAGTQYFFVVTANSPAAIGCSSAKSSEGNATTSGSAPSNGLLNGLVSYWKFDAPNYLVDSADANTLVESSGVNSPNGGIINGFVSFVGVLNSGLSLIPAPANLQLGVGKSFGLSMWIMPAAVQPTTFSVLAGQYSGAAATSASVTSIFMGNLRTSAFCTDATTAILTIAAQPSVAWHHLVVGYDSVNKLLYAQLDNGARVTQATTADINNTNTGWIMGGDLAGGNPGDVYSGGYDETGYWNRVLSTTDVTNLYNAGAGLPFSSFGP